jgi:hypothetical protein
MPRKVKATGVRRATPDIDTESIALALWVQSKRIARERRNAEERARRKRQERDI